MTQSFDTISEPIPISLIAGRYLLFDINVVTYLRRAHHICGVLIGSIPQLPQQNVFLGLPVELLPEEAKLLVEKEVAYVVDDTAWHKERFNTLEGIGRGNYLESLRREGFKAKRTAEGEARKRSQHALAKQAALRPQNESSASSFTKDLSMTKDISIVPEDDALEGSLFIDERATPAASSNISASTASYAITPTTTYTPPSIPQISSKKPNPPVPSSYALFAHLHSLNYFITPGLRFGCDYTVYPGDPLRFHSHFLAVGYSWNAEIPMIDMVGGGRLGTGVKKGFLIGGEDPDSKSDGSHSVRTFCLEWAGM